MCPYHPSHTHAHLSTRVFLVAHFASARHGTRAQASRPPVARPHTYYPPWSFSPSSPPLARPHTYYPPWSFSPSSPPLARPHTYYPPWSFSPSSPPLARPHTYYPPWSFSPSFCVSFGMFLRTTQTVVWMERCFFASFCLFFEQTPAQVSPAAHLTCCTRPRQSDDMMSTNSQSLTCQPVGAMPGDRLMLDHFF